MTRLDDNRKVGAGAKDRARAAWFTWVGHATVLLRLGGATLITDPALGRRVFLLRRLVPPVPDGVIDGIDAILITHAHADHLDPPSLRRIPSARVLAPRAVARALRGRDVTPMSAGTTAALGCVRIEAVHARHDGRRWPHGPAAEAIGFVLRGELAVYIAGDTDLYPEMAELRGRVDVAFLPVWGWGPTLPGGHMDPDRAAEAAAMIAPRVAIPIHWGTLGLPWARASHAPAEAFAAAVASLAPDVEVRVLEPGENTTVSVRPVVPAPRDQACTRGRARPPRPR